MIFSGNTTALGASTIPMAEGYDCSYGVGLALVESARNDLAVFKAMVQADYKEMAICKEAAEGYVTEGEITALQEAVGSGIFKKIADLFKKLIAKIKSIFHTFFAKLRGLYMKDKELVKKYSKEVIGKRNIGKLEVKWRKVINNIDEIPTYIEECGTKVIEIDENSFTKQNWKEDSWERVQVFIPNEFKSASSESELITDIIEHYLDTEETCTIDEAGGMRNICTYLENSEKNTRDMERDARDITKALEKAVKYYDDRASAIIKGATRGEDKINYKNAEGADREYKTGDSTIDFANKSYDLAVACQTATLAMVNAYKEGTVIYHKYVKAAFMKAVAANEKKLEESTYLDAVAEAAEDEVDAVISNALSDEEISKLSAASTNVMDGDASNDPDKLTYGPDCYTKNASLSNRNGSVDSCIGGGKVEESAYFGNLFY